MGLGFLEALPRRLALPTFPSLLLATPDPGSVLPGSHSRCRYRSSDCAVGPDRPNTMLFPPVNPRRQNPVVGVAVVVVVVVVVPAAIITLSPPLLRSSSPSCGGASPGSNMYSPSLLDRSWSDAVLTIGLHPSMVTVGDGGGLRRLGLGSVVRLAAWVRWSGGTRK